MSITTLSSREFNQDISKAKRAAEKGPVIITDRGKPAYVLLDIDDYQSIANESPNIVELLSMKAAAEIELEIENLDQPLSREADLS